jgi:hypothetical protein
VPRPTCAAVFREVRRVALSSAKQIRVLPQNRIRQIVMDSDNDEEKRYPSADTEDEEEPHPPSRRSSISQPTVKIIPPGMLTMQIRWTIATRPVIEYGSEQRISFPTCQDLAILNSYILLSSCGRKKISHRNFRLTLIREMRARAGHELRPSMPVEKPAPASTTSENWIRVTISTRRAAVTWNGYVACLQWRAWREQWCSNVSSVTWCFMWTETV